MTTEPLDVLRRRTDSAKGVEFENLAEEYLRVRFGAVKIWPQIPDLGVDRLFIDKDGKKAAVQMKAYHPKHSVSMRDMTQFIEAARDEKVDFLVLLNTGGISTNAQKVIDRHGVAVHDYDDLIDVSCWEPGPVTVPAPLSMRLYQWEAYHACRQPVDRGQVIMPTGVGKTLVQAAYLACTSSALVMVPSMELVRQTVKTLRRQMPSRPILAVYSGEQPRPIGMPVEVATDPAHIDSFLKRPEHVVVATYQSSAMLEDGCFGHTFDAIVYDEAHRTAGDEGLWKITLDDVNVEAKQRRFFTATPRVHDVDLKAELASAGKVSYSMDEPSIYGDRLYEMSLKQGIDGGYLSPFEIVVGLITDTDVKDQIDRNRWTDVLGDTDAVYDVASVIFTLKQARDRGLHRVLTFHNRVAKAHRAAQMFRAVAAELGIDVNVIAVDATSGEAKRKTALAMLADTSTINIVCNVNLFTEGVDTPALDAIVYFDPKASNIAITQSIGRALRLHPTKPEAYLLVPVYVGDARDVDEMLDKSRWNNVYRVSSALRDLGIIIEQVDKVSKTVAKRIIVTTRMAIKMAIVTESMDIEEVTDATEAILVHGTWDAFHAKALTMDPADYEAFMRDFATRQISDPASMSVEEIASLLEEAIDEVV